MTTESFEELRQRMLRDADIQEMIRARAYEIYRMRGLQPGGAAHDWFQAESEVLSFLLAHHDEQVTDPRSEPVASPSTTEPSPDPAVADSSTELSPQPAAPKKPRQRSASKANSAKKPATRKAGSKKSVRSDSKPKRSEKKSKPEDKPI